MIILSCQQTKEKVSEGGDFTLNLNITGLDSCYVQIYIGKITFLKELVPLNKGVAIIKSKIEFPSEARILFLKAPEKYIDNAERPYQTVYLEKGEIKVVGERANVYNFMSDELSVTGTPLNMEKMHS